MELLKTMAKKSGTYFPEWVVAGLSQGKLLTWKGLNTAVKDSRMLDRGQTQSAINWITSRDGDNIQLRRGKFLLGTTRRSGGHVSGLNVGTLSNGIQTPVFTSKSSVYFLNQTTNDTAETTTVNLLGTAAANDDTNIFTYNNPAGSYIYITSPNSSIYKVSVAKPANAVDQNNGGTLNSYRFGFAKIDQGRFQGMNKFGKLPSDRDLTGRYIGGIDLLGNYKLINSSDTTYPITMSVPKAVAGVQGVNGFSSGATYYYVVTAVYEDKNNNLFETTQSIQSSGVVVDGSTHKGVSLIWTAIAGAKYYNIYRTTSSGTYTTPALAGSTLTNSDPTLGAFYDNIGSATTGAPPSSAPIPMTIAATIQTGDGTTKTFTGTLVYNNPHSGYSGLSMAAPTGFAIQITDGNERFNDDGNGNLVGSLGGTGTIDYMSGAYSVTFNTAPINGVAITYFSLAESSTYGAILDFIQNSSDTTNSRAQPPFAQGDGGGQAMGMASYQGISYDLHLLRTWNFSETRSSSGSAFQNIPYWSKIGIPYPKAFFETGDGVLYIDNTDAQNPSVSILEIPPSSTNLTVVPVQLSQDLDLSPFAFTKAIVMRWGEYDIMSCMNYTDGIVNTYNSATFIRDIYSGHWNQLDYTPACLAPYYGALLMGDSLSPNCFILFSGFDDDGAPIYNYWDTPYTDLDLQGLKQVDYLHVTGMIQLNQQLQISLSQDYGNYSTVFTIMGNGSYVNTSIQEEIGGATVGSSVIGSGSGGGSVYASPFEIDIPVFTGLFEHISVELEALQIGWIQVDGLSYKGIHWSQRSILPTQSIGE